MGEPLMNYKNVMEAVDRINLELGIGVQKITISTVGVGEREKRASFEEDETKQTNLPTLSLGAVPNIRKLITEPRHVKLAVSLHESNDNARNKLIPMSKKFGGLTELMTSIKEYVDGTNRRMTFEWALIRGENDDVNTARELGELIKEYEIPPYLCHINVIPLNPTNYKGAASNKQAVDKFCKVLVDEYRISCTPRVRRGIDIEAGCGQLATEVLDSMSS